MKKKNELFKPWFLRKLAESNKTQQKIADECGLCRSYITLLKDNRIPMPGTLMLLVLSFGVDMESSFSEAGIEMPPILKGLFPRIIDWEI